jgi:hypothetical protein
MIALIDIDHTIADSGWRDPWLGQWDIYHSKSIDDKPIVPVIRAVNAMALLGWEVVLFTSRNERWRQTSLAWLVKHNVLASRLLMRPEDDFSPCGETKYQMAILAFGEELKDVEMVWDNLESVLEPFRARGIVTMLVGAGS